MGGWEGGQEGGGGVGWERRQLGGVLDEGERVGVAVDAEGGRGGEGCFCWSGRGWVGWVGWVDWIACVCV